MRSSIALHNHIIAHAHTTIDRLLDRGAALYDRERDLPRLCPVLPVKGKTEPDATAEIIARLKRALLRERRLGSAGHWSYDLLRHMQLAQALRAEEERAALHGPQTKNAAP